MAAHILTAIEQILEDPENQIRHLPSALNFSTWTEDLDLFDYCNLSEVAKTGDPFTLKRWAITVEDRYRFEWERLGKPKTREEWRKRKYS